MINRQISLIFCISKNISKSLNQQPYFFCVFPHKFIYVKNFGTNHPILNKTALAINY